MLKPLALLLLLPLVLLMLVMVVVFVIEEVAWKERCLWGLGFLLPTGAATCRGMMDDAAVGWLLVLRLGLMAGRLALLLVGMMVGLIVGLMEGLLLVLVLVLVLVVGRGGRCFDALLMPLLTWQIGC